jgi:hypothetical protein
MVSYQFLDTKGVSEDERIVFCNAALYIDLDFVTHDRGPFHHQLASGQH